LLDGAMANPAAVDPAIYRIAHILRYGDGERRGDSS
jgi:hypothetical protein